MMPKCESAVCLIQFPLAIFRPLMSRLKTNPGGCALNVIGGSAKRWRFHLQGRGVLSNPGDAGGGRGTIRGNLDNIDVDGILWG